jgi:hypothetical protein
MDLESGHGVDLGICLITSHWICREKWPLVKSDRPILNFLRTDMFQISRSTLSIIKTLGVFEQRCVRFIQGSETNPIHAFSFEQTKIRPADSRSA